ncbi:CpaE family protein [Streptomyces polyrhachis]|uniref:CpaE family protein n=1 Tax=Streptomyces polyrhachis TaxID=1282885 RepID=A0ABW2G8Y9_9ACTN
MTTLLSQLADIEPLPPVADSTQLVDLLSRVAAESLVDLPEVVLIHEAIAPVPALELIREIALRFPAVGAVLVTADTSPGLYAQAMDSGARGLITFPLNYEELSARVQAAAQWASGVRRHLGSGEEYAGVAGTVVTVAGAKGGVGATVTAVQLALAAQASGRATALVDMDFQTGDIASYLDVQFRRSIADLAGVKGDISPRILQDATFSHPTGLALLLAPVEGERGEAVTDRATRQIVSALRSRYEVVVVDVGSQLNAANAAAVEMAGIAVLVTTPDVVSVRGAKRMVRMWGRLRVRKAEEVLTVVNRHNRATEIQPPLIQRAVGTHMARTTVPAAFKELQGVLDAGRMYELEAKSTIKQALWALAGELGLAGPAKPASGGGKRAKR